MIFTQKTDDELCMDIDRLTKQNAALVELLLGIIGALHIEEFTDTANNINAKLKQIIGEE